MKKRITKWAVLFGVTAAMILSTGIAAMAASTAAAPPTVARTKAWDGIVHTLGGVPESVRKIEYKGSIFYLAPGVSDDDFTAVLAAGPEAVKLKPPRDNGRLYNYPVYILWDSDKTVLLVHPIIFEYDDILDDAAVKANPPASLTGAKEVKTVTATPKAPMTAKEAQEYMLSAEYADAVRTEFYRLLKEHRAANGLKPLEVNLDLQAYADIRAGEQRAKFGHTRLDGSPAGSGWHNARNVLNSRYAENAKSCGALNPDPIDTANGIFTSWKNSAGHNRHMLYSFDSRITMAFGIAPKLDDKGFVTSGAIFATGY